MKWVHMVELDEVADMDLKVSTDPILELTRRKEVLIRFSDAVYTAYKKIVNYLEVVITLSYFQIINSNTLNKS